MVGFARQHLPREEMEAEGITSPAAGEKLTIGLLDAIAVHWLLSIDKRLVSIIKTEFSSDLKVKRLSQMVKVIAVHIDELLQRYSQQDTVNSISCYSAQPSQVSNLATHDNRPKSSILWSLFTH